MDINWATKMITIYKTDSFISLISGTLYEMDTDAFRLLLKDKEDDENGIVFSDTHKHNTQVTIAGITYAETIQIINGYSITFKDGQYSVRLRGSNNNIFDVENQILNQNQVQVIPGNAAGLIIKTGGESNDGWTTTERKQIRDALGITGLKTTAVDGQLQTNFISISEQIKRILGLSQENYRLFNPEYDSDDNLLSITIRIYPTANDCINDSNMLSEYAVTASYVDKKLNTYKVLKA